MVVFFSGLWILWWWFLPWIFFGVGWDVNVYVALMMLRCSGGWGGVGGDGKVHVTLMMLRCSWGLG